MHCNSLCIYVRIMIVIFNVFLSIMNFQTPLAELCLQRAPYMFCGIVLCLVMMRWHAYIIEAWLPLPELGPELTARVDG